MDELNTEPFETYFKDRKKRFLRGLNYLMGLSYYDLEKDVIIKDALQVSTLRFRTRLADVYCLEFTPGGVVSLIDEGITTRRFTERVVGIIYGAGKNINLNNLIDSSIVNLNGKLAIDFGEMDRAPKYGINGSKWCDVAEGPCSCGAWHG